MIFLKTTWKYPPAVHDGIVERRFNPIPDRKVFFMLIVTPIVGGVDDPGQDMHGVELDCPLASDDLFRPLQYRGYREGSVVLDSFDPPPEVPMDDNSQETVTCSKGKEKEAVDDAIRVKRNVGLGKLLPLMVLLTLHQEMNFMKTVMVTLIQWLLRAENHTIVRVRPYYWTVM